MSLHHGRPARERVSLDGDDMLRRDFVVGMCARGGAMTVGGWRRRRPRTITYLLPAPLSLPAFGPFVVAKQRGYFKAEGLDVDFQVAKGGVDVAKQVGAGNAVIGGGIGDTPIIVRPNGVPVKSVAVLGGGALMQLVLDKDKGLKTVKDLKGKTITVLAYQDTTYFALLGMLASQGMTKDDVNAQAAGPVNVWKLFLAGQADAFASTPDWTALVDGREEEHRGDPVRLAVQEHGAGDHRLRRDDQEEPRADPEDRARDAQGHEGHHGRPGCGAAADFVKATPELAGKEEFVALSSSSTTNTSMAARRCWARWTRRGCRRCRTSTSRKAWCGPRRR